MAKGQKREWGIAYTYKVPVAGEEYFRATKS